MKTFYRIQVIDLRFHVDHLTFKKILILGKYRADPFNASLFSVVIRHREYKMVSDGEKITEIKVF